MAGLIQHHHGRVVDAPGDNVLAEFASVVDAVECSVEIQKELKTRNANLPENRRMEFRVGVNLGDQVENKLSVGYQYLGKQSVKNISDPIRTYKVLMGPEAVRKVIGEKESKETRRGWKAIAVVVALTLVAGGLGWNFYLRARWRQGFAHCLNYRLLKLRELVEVDEGRVNHGKRYRLIFFELEISREFVFQRKTVVKMRPAKAFKEAIVPARQGETSDKMQRRASY